MNLKNLLTDDAFVQTHDGNRTGPYKTKFAGHELVFYDQNFHAEPDDLIIQKLANGREKSHKVLDVQHNSGLRQIPATIIVTVQAGLSHSPSQNHITHHTTVNATNVQMGDNNAQYINNAFQELINNIDNSSTSPAQKAEAKSRLQALVENPVVAAILGGVAQGIAGKLG